MKNISRNFFSALIVLLLWSGNVKAFDYINNVSGLVVNVDYKFQTWEPDDITGADVITTGMNLVGLELGYKSDKDKFVSAFRYEFSPVGDSVSQDRLVEQLEESETAWERIFANFSWSLTDTTDISVAYDKQVFLTSVQADRDYWYFDGSGVTLLIPGDIVSNTTIMNEIHALYNVRDLKVLDLKFTVLQAGFYNLSYEKPYSTNLSTGQTGIYRTELNSFGLMAKAQYDEKNWGIGLSYKLGLSSDLTIGASDSVAQLLGDYNSSLGFNELGLAVRYKPFQEKFNAYLEFEYKTRSVSGDVELATDNITSVNIHFSKSF